MRTGMAAVLETFLVAGLSAISPSSSLGAEPLSVTSPDGNLKVEFELKANPQPYLPKMRAYSRVSYKGIRVPKDSPLGLDFVGSPPLYHDFMILRSGSLPLCQLESTACPADEFGRLPRRPRKRLPCDCFVHCVVA